MVQEAPVGVEGPADFEGDRVHAATLVRELDAFAFTEGSAAARRAGGTIRAGGTAGPGGGSVSACGGGGVGSVSACGGVAAHEDVPRSCKAVWPRTCRRAPVLARGGPEIHDRPVTLPVLPLVL